MGEWENAILAQSFPIGGSSPARGTHLLKKGNSKRLSNPLLHIFKVDSSKGSIPKKKMNIFNDICHEGGGVPCAINVVFKKKKLNHLESFPNVLYTYSS